MGDLVIIPRKEYEELLHASEDELRDPDEGMGLRPEFEESLRTSVQEEKGGKFTNLKKVLKRRREERHVDRIIEIYKEEKRLGKLRPIRSLAELM